MRLIPRDTELLVMMYGLSARVKATADLFEEVALSSPIHTSSLAAIKDAEHEGDVLVRAIHKRLLERLLPPFDHEDLYRMATRLDNIIDLIDGTAQCILMFGITEMPERARTMATLIHEAVKRINAAVEELTTDAKGMFDHVSAVKRFE